jgi:UDP-N-acetylglucosamine:LPS N-acetylglucosamine transferase
MFGKKLVFIESYAKVKTPTLTGKLLYHFADRFYVQWQELLEFYPKAIHVGGIY